MLLRSSNGQGPIGDDFCTGYGQPASGTAYWRRNVLAGIHFVVGLLCSRSVSVGLLRVERVFMVQGTPARGAGVCRGRGVCVVCVRCEVCVW